MAKATVRLEQGLKTTITSRHHVYHADEPLAEGGTDTAAMPTEMLMGALGSCIAITMKLYAERKGWDVQSIEIALDFERFAAKDYPAYQGEEQFVHEIRENLVIHGNITADQREKLLEIAKKCPVARLIALPTFWQQTLAETLPLAE
jgi:putative redox protein